MQVVHHRGQWVVLLTWGPAAMRLIERDEWIGWTPQQRAQRPGLIVESFEGTCYTDVIRELCSMKISLPTT